MPSPNEAFVLDASALLSLLNDEPGSERVLDVLPRAIISAVNLSEVVAKLADYGGSETQMRGLLGALHLNVVPFDDAMAVRAGLLRPATRALGLSFGDRACLALAQASNAVVITAGRAWLSLGPTLNVAIDVIR